MPTLQPHSDRLVESNFVGSKVNQKAKNTSAVLGIATTAPLVFTMVYGSLVSTLISPLAILFFIRIFCSQVEQFKQAEDIHSFGEQAEIRITNILKDYLSSNHPHQTRKIYSLADNNRLYVHLDRDLDILIALPQTNIAIEVKSLKGKVFFDTKHNQLRYSNRNGKQRWNDKHHPIEQLKSACNYLESNISDIIGQIDLKLIVFCQTTTVKVFNDLPREIVETVGERRYLKLNGMYIVKEDNLIEFIDALLGSK